MNSKKMKLSKRKETGMCIGATCTLVFGLLAFYKLAPDFGESFIKYIIIALLAAGIIGVLCRSILKDDYIEIVEDGIVISRGAETTKFSYSEYEGLHEVSHNFDGVYGGKTKEMHFVKDGHTTKVSCDSLKQPQLEELTKYLKGKKNEYN